MKRKLYINQITLTLTLLFFSIFSYSKVILNFSQIVTPKHHYPTQFVQFSNPLGVESAFLAHAKVVPDFNENGQVNSFKKSNIPPQLDNKGAGIIRISQDGHSPVMGFNGIGETEPTKEHTLFRKTKVTNGTLNYSTSSKDKTVNSRLNVKNKESLDERRQKIQNENTSIKVTFKVDMYYYAPLFQFYPTKDSVFISGTFPNHVWDKPGTNHLLRMSGPEGEDMIYSITITFDSAQEVQYKFFINAGWGGGEWQGGANRIVNISKDTTLYKIFGYFDNGFSPVYPESSNAWITQTTGFSFPDRGINSIFIVNPNVVWANAFDGIEPKRSLQEFTKTTDGGKTWTTGKYTGVPAYSYVPTIMAVSAQKAWIAAYKESSSLGVNGIFVTNDGGNSWTQQTSADFSDSSAFPDVVYFWDDQNGVCMGDPINNYFEIYTTIDGGTNWVPVPSKNIPISPSGEMGYTDLYAVYGNTIWFGTNKGRVFKSTDRGHHWTVASTGMTEVTRLGFHNSNIGIATYVSYNKSGTIKDFQMTKSVDGGSSWSVVNPSGVYYKTNIAVVPNAPGMLISTGASQDYNQSGSAYSLDEGNTWTQLDDSVTYLAVKFYSSTVGWVGGFNRSPTFGGIWKWQGIPTGITKLLSDSIKIKIYPNPSSGIVHFYLPANGRLIGVSIYDMDGKLVSSLEKGKGIARKDYVMDLRNLTKGIYVAVVRTKQGVSKLKLVLE